MKKLRLLLEINEGPIWKDHLDIETFESSTNIDIVDNDPIIKELDDIIQDKYIEYFEFDSHDEPLWVNKEKMHDEKEEMLSLINKLKDRLNEINDGSFYIVDDVTDDINKW